MCGVTAAGGVSAAGRGPSPYEARGSIAPSGPEPVLISRARRWRVKFKRPEMSRTRTNIMHGPGRRHSDAHSYDVCGAARV